MPLSPDNTGEIVRCHIDFDDFETFGPPFVELIRSELEPFIIGVGRIIVDYADKNLVIILIPLP